MKIPCSSCNQRLEIPEELAGQTIECPACNASLAVPAMAAPPPAPVQESAPQAVTSKKSISSIPKWAIASIAGIAVVVVGLIMFSPDTAVKTDGESQQSAPLPKEKPYEPVADAAKPELLTANAPDISIHEAANEGNIEAVKQHLAAGTDVNVNTNWGRTPLHSAAVNGREEIVELLTSKGADVNAKDDNQSTPLLLATSQGDMEVARLLILKGADVNAKDIWGHTSLHNAAMRDHKELAELLIAKGADVNAKIEKTGDEMGLTSTEIVLVMTPLDFAERKPEIADLLRKHGGKTGAELKAQNNEHGLGNHQNKRLPFLSDAPAGYGYKLPKREPIHDAADNGDIEGVKRHLSAGVDVNTKTKDRYTPLHFASMGGFKENR